MWQVFYDNSFHITLFLFGNEWVEIGNEHIWLAVFSVKNDDLLLGLYTSPMQSPVKQPKLKFVSYTSIYSLPSSCVQTGRLRYRLRSWQTNTDIYGAKHSHLIVQLHQFIN